MFQLVSFMAFELGNDSLCQDLPQFDAPLIEGVDSPNRSLREHGVLVQRDEFSERVRRKPLGQNGVRWTLKRAPRFESLAKRSRRWKREVFFTCALSAAISRPFWGFVVMFSLPS